MQQVSASGKYLRMSPFKVRRVLNQIRGKRYKDVLMLLEFMPYRACGPVWQVVYSAAANAQNNMNLDEKSLFVKSAFADQGPVMKRFRPRAQGRAYRILKATSHITIVISS